MSETTDRLKAEALALPEADRWGLVAALLDSLPTREPEAAVEEPFVVSLSRPPDEEGLERVEGDETLAPVEWEAAWRDEINRRVADLEAGRSEVIPWEVVNAKLKAKYG